LFELVPADVVTCTEYWPPRDGTGRLAVSEVDEFTVTLVAVMVVPPETSTNCTLNEALMKPVPVTEIVVLDPLEIDTDVGAMLHTVGTSTV
jgi:hypothetical protein